MNLRKFFKSKYPIKKSEKEIDAGVKELKTIEAGYELSVDDNVRYVYLNELWHADAWIRGGRIPISLASTYKSEVRDGILTPDENLIYDSPLDFKEEYSPYIKIDGSVIGLTIMNLQINGVKFPGVVNVSRYVEDGIILSVWKKFDVEIGRRFKG
jgi:hypothetical protein